MIIKVVIIIIIIIIIIMIIIISKKASLYLQPLKYNFKAIWACFDIALKKRLWFVVPLD